MLKPFSIAAILLIVFGTGSSVLSEDGVLNEAINGEANTSQPLELGGGRTVGNALDSNAFSYSGRNF
jgi:hypothetical protein